MLLSIEIQLCNWAGPEFLMQCHFLKGLLRRKHYCSSHFFMTIELMEVSVMSGIPTELDGQSTMFTV